MRVPSSIKMSPNDELLFSWADGASVAFPIPFLRDECPCAGCKGESGLFGVYYAPPDTPDLPGKYNLKKITPVGKYAINLVWADGHDSGIYSWEFFDQLAMKLRTDL